MNPAAHGTKHCQRNVPFLPVRMVNVIVVCACANVHGATLHWFFASSATPFSGTLTPRSGTAKVCDARSGSSVGVGLPSTVISPTIPRGPPQYGFRSPVAVSYWSTVIRTSEFAGTFRTVLWRQWPCGSLTRYETQSGCGPIPSDDTVCRVSLARGGPDD